MAGSRLEPEELYLDPHSRELTIGDHRSSRLEPKAFAVLEALLSANGAVVTRQDLLDRCWEGLSGSDEALTQAIAQIRRALGDNPSRPRFLATVPKVGYRWVRPVPVDAAPTMVRDIPAAGRRHGARQAIGIALLMAVTIISAIAAVLLLTRRQVEVVIIRKPNGQIEVIAPAPNRAEPGSR